MKQMELDFKFKEFQEGDEVRLTEIGIRGIEDYYGKERTNNILPKHWRIKRYKIHSVVPKIFPYTVYIAPHRKIGLKKDEIKYA